VTLAHRFDTWVHRGDLTFLALARFRILYGVAALLVLPDFHWMSNYPGAWFNPPLGPMMLLDGFPPEWFLRALELALAVSLVAVTLGWRTKVASFAVTAVSLVGYGFVYSLGKIDHGILFVLLPSLMALAGWGERLSFDSVRRHGPDRAPGDIGLLAAQWPVRLLALLSGLAFLTAAVPKVRGGWLDLDTQAVQNIMLSEFYVHGKEAWLVDLFMAIPYPIFWEPLDYVTVLLEAGLVLCVLTWRSLRIGYAVAATFHLGVFLMLDIAFFHNLVVYAAFVQWDRVPAPAWLMQLPRPSTRAHAPLVVGAGVVVFALVSGLGNAAPWASPVGLLVGGAAGAAYLLWQLVEVRRWFLNRHTERSSDEPPTATLSLPDRNRRPA
jgi:hypothetical protein